MREEALETRNQANELRTLISNQNNILKWILLVLLIIAACVALAIFARFVIYKK